MTNWNDRIRERRLDGNWGDLRVERVLTPCDVEIGPDYPKLRGGAPRPLKSPLRADLKAILAGIVAALLVVATIAVIQARDEIAEAVHG